MRAIIVLAAFAVAATGCSEGAEDNAAGQAAPTKAEKPRARYCFFKDVETKDWRAAISADGIVTVSGKAHVKDPRYKAQLGDAKVDGASAEIWPSIVPNDGYAAPDNWWDVSAPIPASQTVETVTVRCGAKTLAELKVPRGG